MSQPIRIYVTPYNGKDVGKRFNYQEKLRLA
jgi:hypothetical protein